MNDKPKALTEYTLIEQETIVQELDKLLKNHLDEPYSRFFYEDYQKNYHSRNLYFYVPLLNKFFFVNTQHLLNDLTYRNINDSVNTRLLNYSKNDIFSLDALSDVKYGYYIDFDSRTVIYPEIIDLFKEHNPYCAIYEYENFYRYKKENAQYNRYFYNRAINVELLCYAMTYIKYPQIEKLFKAGFEVMVSRWVREPSVMYARSFKNGNNLNEITKLPKFAWQRLKDEGISNIGMWNELRVWIQKDNLSKDQLDTILNLGITETQIIKAIRSVLSYEYNGKKLYTLDSLLNYLERVDMYQAIRTTDALMILRDYIKMAIDCNIEPITNSNSLKREHDVVMRNYQILMREKRQEFQDKLGDLFQERGQKISEYEYSNRGLVVIAPKTIDDLLQEGSHNHNCVGSYVERFAKGQSNIFFIRKEETLEDSYITIEVNGDFTIVRQAFYSSNREITNLNDLKFIEEWIENNKSINKGNKKLEEEKDITDDMF